MDYPKIDLREEQKVNENTHVHLLAGGRGSGKTAAGAAWVVDNPVNTLVIAHDYANVRSTIIEGESGVYRMARAYGDNIDFQDHEPPYYARTYRTSNDARIYATSMDRLISVLGSLRADAKTTVERVWIDEAQHMKLRDWKLLYESYPDAQYLLTFTPTDKKNKFLSYMYRRAGAFRPKYVLYTMSSFDNAGNLAKTFVERVLGMYAQTEMGKSQLHGEYRREYYA